VKIKGLIANICRWKKQEAKYERFIHRYLRGKNQATVGQERIAILVTPWFMTTVPWYSVTLGLMLHRKGRRVTFILDDYLFGNSYILYHIQFKSILRIVSQFKSCFQVTRLSDYETFSNLDSRKQINESVERLADMCTIHHLRGETLNKGRTKYRQRTIQQLSNMVPAILGLLQQEFHYYLIPGGVLGSTGLICELGKQRSVRVASYDSGPGVLLVSTDGVAAQLHDIPISFRELRKENNAVLAFVHKTAKNAIIEREQGKDHFTYQNTPNGNLVSVKDTLGGVLIPLNSSWDSAALGLHHVFQSSVEWLVETVKWFVNHSDKIIYIRQHPAERFDYAKSSDSFGDIIKENYCDHPQVRFIAAEDSMNTYELIKKVSTVIVHTSTVGVEATALGKTVITPSNSYYSELGFVNKARSKDQYFNLIGKALKDELPCEQQQQEKALECYYITQVCNWLFTDFDPASMFDKWTENTIDDLYKDNTVSLMLESIDQNIPISLLAHRKIIGDQL
jgi:hypothetical protein